jgi:hypothetical protein
MKEKQNYARNNNNLITQHKASRLTSEEENNSQMSLTDFNLANRQKTLYMNAYRKSTATDKIARKACYPNKQQMGPI